MLSIFDYIEINIVSLKTRHMQTRFVGRSVNSKLREMFHLSFPLFSFFSLTFLKIFVLIKRISPYKEIITISKIAILTLFLQDKRIEDVSAPLIVLHRRLNYLRW